MIFSILFFPTSFKKILVDAIKLFQDTHYNLQFEKP